MLPTLLGNLLTQNPILGIPYPFKAGFVELFMKASNSM